MYGRIRRLTITTAVPLAILACVGSFGCGDDGVQPQQDLAPPTGVKAEAGDGIVTITWTDSPSEGRGDFTGYNIYRWTGSLRDSTSTAALERHRIATVPKTQSSYADHLAQSQGQNGVRYFYHVRSKGDGISIASGEVQAAGRPEGTGEIIMEFEGPNDSGFDFSTGETVSLSSSNPNRFTLTDFYLGTTDPGNDSTSPLAVKSPHTLASENPEWTNRISPVRDLGTDWSVTTGAEPTADQAAAVGPDLTTPGHVYVFKTQSGNYAKIQITEVSGTAGMRQIEFRYAYQTTTGLYLF